MVSLVSSHALNCPGRDGVVGGAHLCAVILDEPQYGDPAFKLGRETAQR
jgi:hypothetical protein